MRTQNSTGFYVITTFGTKLVILFGSFFVSILLARLLGPEGKGVVTALFVVPNIVISIADLGVRQASAYYIGRKIYSVQDVLSSSLFLWLFTSIISIGIVLSYYSMGSLQEYGWILVLIALIYIPIKLLTSYLNGVIQGKQKIGNINLKELISFAFNLFGVIILVWIFDLGVIGASTVTLLVALVGLIYFIKIVRSISVMKLKYIKPIPQNLFKKGISFALALFILTLNYKIDIIFLERMVTSTEVGIYSVGTNLAELIWQLPAAISIVLFARSANSKTNFEAHNRSAKILRITLPILLFICLFFIITSKYIVTLLYGDEFQQSSDVINILLPGVFIIVISKILHPDMAARGKPLYGLLVFIGPLVLNILLNLLWIPNYGVKGAAWASTISYSLGGILYGIVYAKKVGVRLKDLLILNKGDLLIIKKSINKIIAK
ncbi:oligosaccharide flippase family protein [Gracilibacillus sp. HCP3S3_G5_1]|uniref:oligosaccharide flippase family protein n=1 Tax=unclassified Gracilibacillus TaxID=2625209 RepID=UPI003F89B7A2